jgi:hypothetical protein
LADAVSAEPILRALGVAPLATGERLSLLRVEALDLAIQTTDAGLTVAVETACNDGKDDDRDGRVDLADPGCADAADPSETSPLLACDDGADNDGDLLVDAADPGCKGPNDPNEEFECADGLDNDGDGDIDLADEHCDDAMDNREQPYQSGGTCALGVGLLPLVLLGLGMRRRLG